MYFARQRSANVGAAPAKVGFDSAPIKLKDGGRWISLITSIVAEPWLWMARARDTRRVRAAWATIDDRTLRDIGVSRLEVVYVGARQASGCRYESAQLCDQATDRGSAPRQQSQAAFLGCRML
jgi:uncharacterized protein YjiS (DUF1127 family)